LNDFTETDKEEVRIRIEKGFEKEESA